MPNNKNRLSADTNKSIEANNKQQLKKELMDLFQRHGYLYEGKNCEVTFRTTSGNIAWISINSIETIK